MLLSEEATSGHLSEEAKGAIVQNMQEVLGLLATLWCFNPLPILELHGVNVMTTDWSNPLLSAGTRWCAVAR